MAFTRLGEVNRPSIVVWPLCGSEAAWQKAHTLLLEGVVNGS
jgi:hypothetical protein